MSRAFAAKTNIVWEARDGERKSSAGDVYGTRVGKEHNSQLKSKVRRYTAMKKCTWLQRRNGTESMGSERGRRSAAETRGDGV